MQVVDHVVNDHELLVQLQVCQLLVEPLRAELAREDVRVADAVDLLHQLRPVLSELLHVLTCLEVSHGLALVEVAQVEDVAVERRLNEFADRFSVEQLILEVLLVRLGVELDIPLADALLNLLRRDHDLLDGLADHELGRVDCRATATRCISDLDRRQFTHAAPAR